VNIANPLGFLLRNSSRQPDAPAATFADREFTHAQLLSAINNTAQFLASQGVGPDCRVAIYSDDDFDLCRAYAAIWSLGATAIPLNISYSDAALTAMEESIRPDIGLYSGSYSSARKRAFPLKELVCETNEDTTFTPAAQDDDAISVVLFTSGSSGLPKAIPLSNRQLANNALSTARRLGIDSSDRILITTPLYTTSSLVHLLTMLSVGASIVVERGFLFGSAIVAILEKYACSGFGGVPANFIRLAPATEQAPPPARLRFLMNSGEHLPVPILKLLRSNWPAVQIYCAYGLTEVAGRLCILDPDKVDRKPGSVGQPLAGMTIRVLDENGRQLPPGATGEVSVSGLNLMSGYLNDENANAVMTAAGFATGDFGWLDSDGDLFLAGRADDIIKVGGEKVSTLAIESAVCALSEVSECAAVAVEDPRMGTVPWLYYVSPAQDDIANLVKAHLRDTLPSNHMPLRLVRIDALPRTTSGKVARKQLRQEG
jgi:long-chain acyl-CoA synthetase